MSATNCRACRAPLSRLLVDLGVSPLANSFLDAAALDRMEPFYPLRLYICDSCCLAQIEDFGRPAEIFDDYLYYSSFSSTWLAHCRAHAGELIPRLGLGSHSRVVEIASNDGCLLGCFAGAGIPVLGVEPSARVARAAMARGIPTDVSFFGRETARRLLATHGPADLMIANNVLAHVPDPEDFLDGFRILLAPGGVISFEFPHLLELLRHCQFDTIYHEHFSYLSVTALEPLFRRLDLAILDVGTLPTHGGSLRVHAGHRQGRPGGFSGAGLARIRAAEKAAKLDQPDAHGDFAGRVLEIRAAFLEFLLQARRQGKVVAAWGAAAKGNTLLNHCGAGHGLITCVGDSNVHKQGLFTPGQRIRITDRETLFRLRPDYIVILPWNLREEIAASLAGCSQWGAKFVVAIPGLEIFGADSPPPAAPPVVA